MKTHETSWKTLVGELEAVKEQLGAVRVLCQDYFF
jgi:hypothetical protein